MATSGTMLYSVSRDDIITEALSLCGVQDPSIPLTAADISTCSTSLNVMCKAMVMDGLPLWTVEEVTVPMVTGQSSYEVGPWVGINNISMTNNGTPITGALQLNSLGTVSTTASPFSICVSPDGLNAYVVQKTFTTIAQYSISGGLLTHIGIDVATGSNPYDIQISPDGLNVYVSNSTSNTITQYSRSNGLLTSIGTISLSSPTAICISPDGLNVYVLSGFNIVQYSRSAGLLTHIGTDITLGSGPLALAISPDGLNVYVSSGSSIIQYSRSAGILTHIGTDIVASGTMSSIIVSPDGLNVYAVNFESTIFQYSVSAGLLTHIGTNITITNVSERLVISPDGLNVYVTNNTGSIFQYVRSSGILTHFGTDVSTSTIPFYIVITPDGSNVYVTNSTASTVSQYGRTFSGGTFPLTFTGGTGSGASGTYTISTVNGKIGSTSITTPGSYIVAPNVTFLFGNITGAIGTAVLGIGKDRPLRIMQAFIRDSNGNDTILTVESRYEYNINGMKTSQSTPNQLFYDPQLKNGIITVFGVPPDSSSTIHLIIQRQLQDFNLSTDTPDFPQEGYLMLSWGLADMVSLKYRVPRDVRAELAMRAKIFKDEFFAFQQDYVPIQVVPGDSITLDNYSSSY